MSEKTFNALAVTVTINGTDNALDRVARYFPAGDAEFGHKHAHITLRLVQPASLRRAIQTLRRRPAHRTANGHPDLTYNVWDDSKTGTSRMVPLSESPHVLTVRRHTSHLLEIRITAADDVTLGRTATRVTRQLMLRTSEKLMGCGAHGAAVAYRGNGIVLGGLPGAGKSTVALALAARYGADLVASDRIVFIPRLPGNAWNVSGIPVPWRLANGTINALPQLSTVFEEGIDLFRGNRLVGGKHEMITEELSAALGVGEEFCVPLRHVVILSRDPLRAVTVQELTWTERYHALRSTLFNPADQLFVTDWLGLSVPSNTQLFASTAMLANRVRVFRATWPTHDSIPAVAERIASRLRLEERR